MTSSGQQRPFHIFISRVTGEFGRVSEALAADLRSKGVIGKVQVDFRQEEGTETTLDKLEQYVHTADAVIALIGQRSGSYPPEDAAAKWAHVLPAGITKATYTQWEVHFARHYKRRLSIYFGFDHAKATAYFKPEFPPDPATDDLTGQEVYALWLTKTLGVDRDYFTSEHHLCRLVLKETWPVEIMSGPVVVIHPQDLEKLILFFDSNVDLFAELTSATNDPEFAAPALKAKNEINNLSEEYFQSSVVDDMPQFKVIRAFLINPRNQEWRKRYGNIARQFKNKYQAHRNEFGAFEKIFDDIFDRLQARGALAGQDALIYAFLHYMYCNCDLGRRTPEEKP
jgi:hypothetical protein